MQFDYPHSFDTAEVKERLEALGDYLKNRHGINVGWDGNVGSVNGKYLMITIEGRLEIGDKNIHFEGKDPGMLWRKKAVKYLQEKLDIYLDKNTPVAELPRRA
jgi:hypothetical protein